MSVAPKRHESLTESPLPAASTSEDNHADSDDNVSSSEHEPQPDSLTKPQDSDSNSDSDSDDNDSSQPQPPQPASLNKPQDSDSDSDSHGDSKSNPTFLSAHVPSKRKNTDVDSSDMALKPKKARNDKTEPSGSTPAPDDDDKKPLFQRLWSEGDEIVLLKGLIEYKAKNGKDPMSDVDGFLNFIKDSLHVVDVKKQQIVSKVRRLKGRFHNAKKRNLTNPHDLKAFALSKNIWGGSDDGDGNIKGDEGNPASGSGVVRMMSASGVIQLEELNKFGDVSEKFMNEGLKLLGNDETHALEEEWFNSNVAQMESLVKRLVLYQKTTNTLLNALKRAKR